MNEVIALVWTPATTKPTISNESIQIDFLDNTQKLIEVDTDISDLSTELQAVITALFNRGN